MVWNSCFGYFLLPIREMMICVVVSPLIFVCCEFYGFGFDLFVGENSQERREIYSRSPLCWLRLIVVRVFLVVQMSGRFTG